MLDFDILISEFEKTCENQRSCGYCPINFIVKENCCVGMCKAYFVYRRMAEEMARQKRGVNK